MDLFLVLIQNHLKAFLVLDLPNEVEGTVTLSFVLQMHYFKKITAQNDELNNHKNAY